MKRSVIKGLDNNELNKLAEIVARKLAQKLAVPPTLVGLSGIETMLGYSRNSPVIRKIVKSNDFPLPLRISGEGHPRWLKADVDEWIRKKQAEESRMAFQIQQETKERQALLK